MRVLSSMILCLFMALCVLANDDDFVLGGKKECDRLVYKKLYIKFPNVFNPTPTVRILVKTLRRNEVITHVKLRNTGDKRATFTVVRGEIGKRVLVLRAEAKFGEILLISVEAYASVVPATTRSATTIEPTTVKTKISTTTIGTVTIEPTIEPTTVKTKVSTTTISAVTSAPGGGND